MPDQGRRTAWGFLLAVVVAIGLPVGLAACGSQQPPGEGDLLGDGGALFEGGYIGFVCTPGTEGCDCTTAGEQAACGKVVDKAGSYVTCSMGYSTCDGKKWGVCVGNQIVAQSLPGTSLKADGIHTASLTGPCANPCDPNSSCMAITPTAGDVPDAQGIIVTEGGVSLTGEGGTGGCTGLGCMVSKCVGTPTTITGTVYDPAGRNALYNATVFVPIDPAGTLPALTEGASCNTCAAAASQSVVATTTTAVDGSFTLSGVPDGANIPIVIQLGKWRRELIFTNVNPCTSNTITNNCTASDQTMCTFHLPRNQYDGYNPADGTYDHGDIPQMAVVEGAWDPLACVLLKAGVDPSEFSSYDGKTPSSGGTVTRPGKRIHYYAVPASENLYYGGAPYLISLLSSAYGNNISGQPLWTSGVDPTPSTPTAPHYDYYDAVMFACTGQYTNWETEYGNPSPNVYQTLVNYANAGGRVFATHHGNTWIDNNLWGANPATWGDITAQNFVPAGQLSGTEGATIIQTFPKGAAFAQWLFDVGASPTLGTLTLTEPREDLSAVGANSTAWMKMASALHAGTFPPHFTFNTPYNNAATSQCGRVLYSDFHVAESALVQNGTPTSNKCLDNLDCGYTETCYGATGGTGTCSEPCRTNADCPDTTYSCNGATPGSCGPPACTHSTSYSCAIGVCTAQSPTALCVCSDDSQCPSNKCINTTGCTGTCSGTGSGDAFGCKPVSTTLPSTCSSSTTHTCTVGTCNTGHTACLCTADSQCASNKCIISAGQNNGVGQCTAGTCTGSGVGDSASCQAVAADPCSANTLYSCTEGTCNAGHSACVCTDNSQCASGKCINTTSCTGTCTGTGVGDGANCVAPTAPPACTPSTTYACAGGLGTCNTADTACLCISDSQCASKKCVISHLQNDGVGQCTAGTCTGSGATDAASCLPVAADPCTSSTMYSCAEGACNAGHTACICTDNSQCASGQCINTTSCTGTCSGTGSGDSASCVPAAGQPACDLGTNYSCTLGVVNQGNSACICINNSQCASGECIILATQNDGPGQCTGATCTGTGSGDSASCVPVASTATCSGTTSYSCSEGTCNAGHTACVCTDNSQCASGKCINTTSCTGTCTGTGAGDSANCAPSSTPPSCTAGTSYSCAGGLGTCDTAHNACYCTANSQCSSGQCIKTAGQNDGAGQCTGATCTGTGAGDSANCMPFNSATCTGTTTHSCTLGACNAGDTGCVCTADTQCQNGLGKCIKTAGVNDGGGQCTAGTCTGLGTPDAIYCATTTEPASPPTGTTVWGGNCPAGTTANSAHTYCVCTADSACPSGACIATLGQNEGAGQCGHGSTCSGAGSGDNMLCATVTEPGTEVASTTDTCPAGEGNCSNVSSSSGTCSAAGVACWCTTNSQCASGVCRTWAGCSGTCSGASGATTDTFNCVLQAPGIPVAPTSEGGTTYSCTTGGCNTSHDCWCTNNSQCPGSGKCIKTAGQNDGAGQCTAGTCTGSGTADNFNCQAVSESGTCSADSQCDSGKCIGSLGNLFCALSGPCSGSGSGDAHSCMPAPSVVACTATNHYWCSTDLYPLPVPNTGDTACLCVSDSQCPSGKCINSGTQNQCSGYGPCTGSGTADTAGCEDFSSATTSWSCGGHGNCSTGACAAAGVSCVCTKDADCSAGSGKCVNSAACSGGCSGASPADGFNCELGNGGIPATPTAGATIYTCGTGGCDTSHDCWCTNNSQCPGSGKCIKTAGQNDGTGECTAGTCTGSGTADNFNCQAVSEPGTCSADSQCDSGKCIGSLGNLFCALSGPCSGSGSGDAHSCMPAPSVVACTATVPYSCAVGVPNTGDTACFCTSDGQCPSGKCINNATKNQCGGLGPCTGSGTADSASCQDYSSAASTWACSTGNCSSGSCTAAGQACVCKQDSDCGAGTGKCLNSGACSGGCSGAAPVDGFNCQLGNPGIPSSPTVAAGYTCAPGEGVPNTGNTKCLCTSDAECGESGSGKCINDATQHQCTGLGPCTGSGTADPATNCQEVSSSAQPTTYSCAAEGAPTSTTAAGPCLCTANSQCQSNLCANAASQCGGLGPCTGSLAASLDTHDCVVPTYTVPTSVTTYSCSPYGVAVGTTTCICTADSQCDTGKCIKVTGENDGAGQCGNGSTCSGTGSGDSASCAILTDTCTAHTTYACTGGGACTAPGTTSACTCTTDTQCPSGKCINTTSCTGTCSGTGAGDSFSCMPFTEPSTCNSTATHTCTGGLVCNTADTACLCTADSQCVSGQCLNDATQHQCGGLGPCTAPVGSTVDSTNCLVNGEPPASCTSHTSYACTKGTCTTPGSSTACTCTDNSQCPSNKCINTTSCTGACTGTGAGDPFSCVPFTEPGNPATMTTYSCTGGLVCNATNPCTCDADSQCPSGKCIVLAGVNDGAGQCGHGTTCSGTGAGDAENCVPFIEPPHACTSTVTHSCALGTCNVGNSACTCTDNSQCPSGKCVSTAQCTGTCNGTGAPDTFGCMPFTEPSACTSTTTHSCTGGLTCNAADTACICTADSQCASNKCIVSAGVNDGAGECGHGSTCSGTGVGDSENCVPFVEPPASCTSTTTHSCTVGTCNAGDTACTCTDDSQCPSNKCVSTAQCTGTCSGTGSPDSFGCMPFTEPASACTTGTAYACMTGVCNAGHTECTCTDDSQCLSGACINTPACTGSCTGVGTPDVAGCQAAATIPTCVGTAINGCAVGTCDTATGTICQCTTDSQCPSGKCVPTANNGNCASGGPCTGSGAADNGSCEYPAGGAAPSCYANAQCGVLETCGGIPTLGNCYKACTTNAQCTGGEKCSGGSCQACTSSSQCKDRSYTATCNVATAGAYGKCCYGTSHPDLPVPPNTASAANSANCAMTATTFPESCSQAPMSDQEKALEFMMFDLTSCVESDTGAVTPPLKTESFYLDFTATCPSGTFVKWREFDFQDSFPNPVNGSSIIYTAQTGPVGADAASWVPGMPLPLATANTNTVLPGWDVVLLDTSPVETPTPTSQGVFNQATPAITSQTDLRIWITINPTSDGTQSPTLANWRAQYDCPATE